MGLEVKNNRDGKSHTLRFVCHTCSAVYLKRIGMTG